MNSNNSNAALDYIQLSFFEDDNKNDNENKTIDNLVHLQDHSPDRIIDNSCQFKSQSVKGCSSKSQSSSEIQLCKICTIGNQSSSEIQLCQFDTIGSQSSKNSDSENEMYNVNSKQSQFGNNFRIGTQSGKNQIDIDTNNTTLTTSNIIPLPWVVDDLEDSQNKDNNTDTISVYKPHPKSPQQKVSPIRDPELVGRIYQSLLDSSKKYGLRNATIFALQLAIGRRTNDIARMKVGDVADCERRVIKKVITVDEHKTGKTARDLPLDRKTRERLGIYIGTLKDQSSDALLFPSQKSGKDGKQRGLNTSSLDNIYQKYTARVFEKSSNLDKDNNNDNHNNHNNSDNLNNAKLNNLNLNNSNLNNDNTPPVRENGQRDFEVDDDLTYSDDYNRTHITTYAARKTYGYNIYTECMKNHGGFMPGTDVSALEYVQSVFNHKDSITTLRYIGAYDMPARELMEGIGSKYDF